jgi:hypothetical protein
MKVDKRDARVVAETLVALHDDGILSTYDPEIISGLEKTFGFKDRELCNKIDEVLMERLEPQVEYALFGTYVKVIYDGKIYYFNGTNKCYYREPSWMDSMDAFYSADVIIDAENGHILKNRHHTIVDIFENFFDKEYGFSNETY